MSLVRLLGYTTLACGCVVGRYREVASSRELAYVEEKGWRAEATVIVATTPWRPSAWRPSLPSPSPKPHSPTDPADSRPTGRVVNVASAILLSPGRLPVFDTHP